MKKLTKFLVDDSTVTIVEELPSKIVATFPAAEADRFEKINGFIKKSCLKELESKFNDLIKEYDLVEGEYSVYACQKEDELDLIYITIEKDLSRISIENVLIDTNIKEIYILETKLIKENKVDSLECFLNNSYIKELLKSESINDYRNKDYRVFKANFSHNFMNERSKELSKMTFIQSLSGRSDIFFEFDNLPAIDKRRKCSCCECDTDLNIVLSDLIDKCKRNDKFKRELLEEKEDLFIDNCIFCGAAIHFYKKEVEEIHSLINKYIK